LLETDDKTGGCVGNTDRYHQGAAQRLLSPELRADDAIKFRHFRTCFIKKMWLSDAGTDSQDWEEGGTVP
jgi:hypothetical protein